jgi:hypothetical protein
MRRRQILAERARQSAMETIEKSVKPIELIEPIKKSRGRPKGSKNK